MAVYFSIRVAIRLLMRLLIRLFTRRLFWPIVGSAGLAKRAPYAFGAMVWAVAAGPAKAVAAIMTRRNCFMGEDCTTAHRRAPRGRAASLLLNDRMEIDMLEREIAPMTAAK